jgi:trk system potassium uptake protein
MRLSQTFYQRYYAVLYHLGVVLTAVALFLLVPLVYWDGMSDTLQLASFLLPSLTALLSGALCMLMGRRAKDFPLTIQDGGVIVVLAWTFAILFSSMPFVLYGMLNPLQALFETVSGWTTTGLSVVDVEAVPRAFLFWRSLMQFLGGAGLAVIMLSAIIGPASFGLYNAEGRTDQLLPSIRRSAKMIMVIYSGYTLAGVALYLWAGMNGFDALNHSMAALSTGGFSTRADSIAYWNSIRVEMVTIVLMILGTMNFALHYLLLRGKFRALVRNGEMKVMVLLLALSIPAVTYYGLYPLYGSLSEAWRVSVFSTVSALSTTGYSTVSFAPWNGFAVLIIILLMLAGGGINSTAGGLKQYRIYVLSKALWWDIRRFLSPKSAVRQDYIYRGESKDYLDPLHIRQTSNYLYLYMVTYFFGVLVYLAAGYTMTDSMFEFASALGTVGLSIGVTAASNPPSVLWAGIVGMTLGRLEFMVIFYTIVTVSRDVRKWFAGRQKGIKPSVSK